MHDAHETHVAPTDEAPTLKYFVVWGGQYEGVHGIFDTATELQPLIEMPGARAYGPADGVVTKKFAEMKLQALQNARAAQQWRDSAAPVPRASNQVPNRATTSPERVVQGIKDAMSYPEARMAIASLSPTSPIRDIRHVIEAAGMPVSTAVGGRGSRNRGDILAEARGCLGMTVPPEWALDDGCPIAREQQAIAQAELGDESGDPSVTRRGSTSPLTLIDDVPIMTEKQVAGIAISACILFTTIALVLATGVPIGPLCLAIVTYLGRTTGAVSGLRMVTDKPADQAGPVTFSDLEWARSTSAGGVFAATTATQQSYTQCNTQCYTLLLV